MVISIYKGKEYKGLQMKELHRYIEITRINISIEINLYLIHKVKIIGNIFGLSRIKF